MALESQVIPLEGEQALVFQAIDAEENAILAKLAPLRARRNDMVSIILAGRGLLTELKATPHAEIDVSPDRGIIITVPLVQGDPNG